jgi:phage gp36-like protein
MIFLTENDFNTHLSENIIEQITSEDSDLLDAAEATAIGIVTDMIAGMYDIDSELEQTGSNRHAPLKLWLLAIAAYQLYRAIPDSEVPDRIIKDYDDAIETLRQIGRGKMPTSLTPVNTASGTSKRVFRMKSNTPRQHNML